MVDDGNDDGDEQRIGKRRSLRKTTRTRSRRKSSQQQQPGMRRLTEMSNVGATTAAMASSGQQTYDNAPIMMLSSASTVAPQPFPQQQLNMTVLNPFPQSVFSYTIFLCCSLVVWVLYLLLPRGLRKQYCLANRKRYERRVDDAMPAAGYWLPVRSVQQQQQQQRPRQAAERTPASRPRTTPNNNNNNNRGIHDQYTNPSPAMSPPRGNSSQQQSHQFSRDRSAGSATNHPPSPDHPALKKIPPNKILAETMARLQGRGIRLIAHGVHCDPKRVWVRLEDEEASGGMGGGGGGGPAYVTWQTEFPRRVPNQSGQVSIVLMRGSLHRIALPQVLYVDVGKKTHALQVLPESKVQDTTCLSLLTQNGSLDLQANSKLERDALVSCFSMILDDVHGDEDWRALYEASPDPSLANSSTAIGGSSIGGGTRGRFVNL